MKKIICNITFLIIATSILTSCAPKSEDKQRFSDLKDTPYTYQPRNEDTLLINASSNLNFNIKSTIGLDRAQRNQSPWLDDSVEIFRLAENTMTMGDFVSAKDRVEYKKFGHDLMRLFYQSKENSTQFDKTQTLFLPAALGFEGKKIKGLFTSIASPQTIAGVEKVFANHKIQWPQPAPTLKPAEFIRSIKSYLLETSKLFSENGVAKEFVKSFTAQVDKDYIQALNQGEVKLKSADQNQSLKLNSTLIPEVIQTLSFIPPEVVKPLIAKITQARIYSDLIEPAHASGLSQPVRMVQVITSVWLDLNPQQREKYIKPANKMLYDTLGEQSAKMLEWLAGRRELSLSDKEYYADIIFDVKSKFIQGLGTSCHKDIQGNIAAWLTLNETQRAELKTKNPQIYNLLSSFTVPQLKSEILTSYDGQQFKEPLILDGVIEKFNAAVFPICISRIQTVLDKSINIYLLTELDIQIRNWGALIEKVVAEKTLLSLNSINSAVASPDEFKTFFNKMAIPIVNELLFNDTTLDGIENSKIQLFVDGRNQFNTKRLNFNVFDTGAETLGVSLAAQYRRILELAEFENMAPTSKDYYKIIFSQINKMISMIGFRTMDNKLVPSLNRNFKGDIPELDVYKYECNPKKVAIQKIKKEKYELASREGKAPSADDYVDLREDCDGFENYYKNIYEIPDNLKIIGPFNPGTYQRSSSIRSQSEIIRGAAMMLKYFSDWNKPNDFDLGMGKVKYSDINVFPKSAFVNLAVATMTVPIRGLQKENSPLKLFGLMGQEIDLANGLPDGTGPVDPSKQIIQAAIVNLMESGPSKVVKLEDMAYFMISVDEFLKATNGIEKTHASVINPPDRTVKENLESIIKGRRLLSMMMFAMSNFIVNRMQNEDGGFHNYYSLETNQIIHKDEPRTLEVQLTTIDALIRVYGQWKGQASLLAAVEAYYYMNQKLWNPEISFYKMNESTKQIEVTPHLYLKAVMNFKVIAPYLNNNNSRDQAERLFDYYSKEFLNWNQTSQPMSTQFQ